MKLAHVFILREESRPTQAEAARIWSCSRLGRSFINSGIAYAQLEDGQGTLRLSAASPAAARGSLQELMPVYIRSEVPLYIADIARFRIESEQGVDEQTKERFCVAAVYEV